MSWITPTAADVITALPEGERDLYTSYDDGAEDPLVEILANTVAKIRGRIGACSKNVLDPDPATIPAPLKGELMAMVRYELIGRLGAEELADSDPRRVLYNEAVKTLAAVARCEVFVEAGASIDAPGISLVSSREHREKRKNFSGLL